MRSLLFVLLVATAALFAQTPTAVVNGTVVDSSGAVVPDARVVAVNQETNVASQKNTAADGTFAIINLLPGNYVLTVEKGGFKKAALPVFKLDVNQTLTEKIELQVGSSTETVTISAESVGVMLQRATTELGTTIDEQMMHELPLNGRNFTELLILQPGVNPVNTAQGGNGIGSADGGNIGIPNAVVYRPSVNGAGNRSNAFYLDGIINTDDRGGGWAIQPIADTIQEFKVQSHNNDASIRQRAGRGGEHGDQVRHQQIPRFGMGIRAQPDFRRPQSVHGLLHSGQLPVAGQRAAKPGEGRHALGVVGVVDPFRNAGVAARATWRTCTAVRWAGRSSRTRRFSISPMKAGDFRSRRTPTPIVPTPRNSRATSAER